MPVIQEDVSVAIDKILLATDFTIGSEMAASESSYDWCSPECVVDHGEATKAILQVAGRVHADLIILGARKASFLLEHVERGLIPSLLAEAKCPVLTVC